MGFIGPQLNFQTRLSSGCRSLRVSKGFPTTYVLGSPGDGVGSALCISCQMASKGAKTDLSQTN
jgi:hypothetical protein